MDVDLIRETLDTLADGRTAATRRREITPLKGIRGVPDGEIARLAAALWQEERVDLDGHREALSDLFGGAYEDGLVAVALVSAALPDDPEAAFELGMLWLDRVDDHLTADALGVLILGPGVLAAGRPLDELAQRGHRGAHVSVRRAIAAAALAWLPEPVTGPAAAALRQRLGTPQVAFVEAPLRDGLSAWLDAFHRDEDPAIRKVMRRLLRTWTRADPEGVTAWADTVRGGLPKLLGDEVRRARRRAQP